jgi:hypothetical protein
LSLLFRFSKILYEFLISHMRATIPAHLILLNLFTLIEVYKLWSSTLCSPFQPPATSSLAGPNVFLRTLFSNTLNLCSLSVRDHVSHPYKTVRKIMVFYFKLLKRRREDKKSELNGSKHFRL